MYFHNNQFVKRTVYLLQTTASFQEMTAKVYKLTIIIAQTKIS